MDAVVKLGLGTPDRHLDQEEAGRKNLPRWENVWT